MRAGSRPFVVGGLTAVLVSVAFIDRSAFRVGGRLYFALFDDAMVSMRFAKNFAHGQGLVWNPGQHPVEGYSNFLWTLVMTLVHLLPLSDRFTSLAMMIVGSVLLMATAFIASELTRELGGDTAARTLAAVLAASYAPLVYWTLRGMEVGAVTTAVLGAALLAIRFVREGGRRRLILLCVIIALGVLVRDDVVVPMIVIIGFVAFASGGRRRVQGVAFPVLALVVTVLAHTAFRLAYYGNALPNTYYLKIAGSTVGARIDRGAAWFFVELCAELFLLVVLVAWWQIGSRTNAGLLLLGLFVSEGAYMIYVGGDAWEVFAFPDRFLTPGVVALIPCASVALVQAVRSSSRQVYALAGLAFAAAAVAGADALSLAPLARITNHAEAPPPLHWEWWAAPAVVSVSLSVCVRLGSRSRLRLACLVTASAAVFVALSGWVLWDFAVRQPVVLPSEVEKVPLGLATKAATAPNATVAVVSAGATPYFDDRPSVDILGKSDSFVARTKPHGAFIPGHDKWDYDYSIGRLRPDIVLEFWQHTGLDIDHLPGWGYKPITPCYDGNHDYWFVAYYRPSARVHIGPLRRFLASTRSC